MLLRSSETTPSHVPVGVKTLFLPPLLASVGQGKDKGKILCSIGKGQSRGGFTPPTDCPLALTNIEMSTSREIK